jgi:catechol 2,3-dioxygenase
MGPLPSDARIGHVRLRVSDLARSVAFYTDVLGLGVHAQTGREATLGPAGGRVLFHLDADPHARPKPRRSSGLFHVAVLVPDRPWLGHALRRLIDRRWPLSGAADHLVSEALYLDDPDGLGLEIYRDRSRDAWQVDQGEVLMATEALDLHALAAEPAPESGVAGDRWPPLPADTIVGHVHLQVPDLESAEALYCDDIGFTPTLRRYPGALFVAAGGYHHHLGLNTWAGRGVPPPPADAVGLLAFTIEASALTPRVVPDARTGVSVVCRAQQSADEAGA